MEAAPDLITDLKTSGGFLISTINSAGALVAFPVPLVGFAEALAGPPVEASYRQPAERPLV